MQREQTQNVSENPKVSPEHSENPESLESLENKEEISVSFLLTKEDYGAYCVEAVKARIPNRDRMLIRILGAVSILAGFMLAFFLRESPWGFGWTACLELLGLVLLIWYDFILPSYVRASACGYMDRHREQLTSRNFIFTPSRFFYTSDGCSMEIPYQKLHQALESGGMLLLYLGADDPLYLPKRAVSQEELETIRSFLSSSLNEKFHQEGAR